MSGQHGLSLLMGQGALPQRIAARARAAEGDIARVAEALSAALGTEVLPIRAEASRKAAPPAEGARRWPRGGTPRLVYEMLPEHALKLAEAAFGTPVQDEALAEAVVARALDAPLRRLAGEAPEEIRPGVPLLACTYCLELRGEPVTLTVHLPTGRGPCFGDTPAFLKVAVAVEAALGRLDMPVSQLAALKPGDRLPLPGSSLDAITLSAQGAATTLARGELGKDAARRAIRLTGVAA